MEKNTLIYGIRAVIEAVDSNESINRVFMQRGLNNKNGFELIKKLNKNSIEISYVPIEKLNRLTPKNHQGVVATISPINFLSISDLSDLIESKPKSISLLSIYGNKIICFICFMLRVVLSNGKCLANKLLYSSVSVDDITNILPELLELQLSNGNNLYCKSSQ